MPVVRGFNDCGSPYFEERNLRISGTTKDASGAAIASCSVVLIETPTNITADSAVSDANGAYMLQLPTGLSQTQTTTWRVNAYKAGSPDVAGTTVNTLTGS